MRVRPIIRELQAFARWPRALREAQAVPELKIILGAADTSLRGWISTGGWTLDVTRAEHFQRLLKDRAANAFLAEHVWEHLDQAQVRIATKNCFRFLQPGGHFRVAVPDGFHPDPEYIRRVEPGGTGAGADDHKYLYNYETLSALLREVGFEPRPLEWWDESGEFHFVDWSVDDGYVERSSRFDARNQARALQYTSLIIDGVKPAVS